MELKISTKIYPPYIIRKAVLDYKDVANIRIVYNSGEICRCLFECEADDFEIIKNEFCNYMIALLNVNAGV